MVLDRFSKTCAITFDTPKTASLVFEKVIGPFEAIEHAPTEIVAYKRDGRMTGFPSMSGAGPEPEQRQVMLAPRQGGVIITAPSRATLLYMLNHQADKLCGQVRETGHRPVLCYPSIDEDSEVFKAGDTAFIVSCLKNLDIVDEEQLTCEQVAEFRRDLEARAVRTRFLFWLNEQMDGKSKAKVQDHLADLCDQHGKFLRKFGIYVKAVGEAALAVGEKSGLVSKGSLAAALLASSVADEGLVTLLAAGLHLGRETWMGVRKANADLKNEHDALAFIHRASELSKPEGDR